MGVVAGCALGVCRIETNVFRKKRGVVLVTAQTQAGNIILQKFSLCGRVGRVTGSAVSSFYGIVYRLPGQPTLDFTVTALTERAARLTQ